MLFISVKANLVNSVSSISSSFSQHTQRYKTEDIYMVTNLPAPMLAEWQLPRFLQCGGYKEHMMFVNMWFSSGGTKSVLHSDSYENFHCLVSGRKEFILIEPHYSEVIGPEHQVKGYYDIDVEKYVVDHTHWEELWIICVFPVSEWI